MRSLIFRTSLSIYSHFLINKQNDVSDKYKFRKMWCDTQKSNLFSDLAAENVYESHKIIPTILFIADLSYFFFFINEAVEAFIFVIIFFKI